MVSFSLTPFSSMSTVCFRISTVWLMRSSGKGTWLGGASLTSPPTLGSQDQDPVLIHSSVLALATRPLLLDPEQETHAVGREEQG